MALFVIAITTRFTDFSVMIISWTNTWSLIVLIDCIEYYTYITTVRFCLNSLWMVLGFDVYIVLFLVIIEMYYTLTRTGIRLVY